ncbi:DNA-directed DNA polymerase [Caerostris darwini]|uniref:DNA-directed DNA polymerase n=1 Tax=Caerostris darwini TaxID=1538125 RepID=A0AAV4SXH5_9ARAC|nr:DNA-directed DNA polymerase [Caerostris darwini]
MQTFQSGGGISDAEVVDLNDAVIILAKSRRKNKKCQAEEIIFKARVDPERLPSGIADVPLGTIIGAVRQLFLTIIERTTETLAPTDLIRFYIQDDHLDHPISTTIMPVSDLIIEKILTEILKVTYKGKERPLRINLWHHDNHYDVIKSVKGFFGSSYYCENCEKPYSHCEAHQCPKACYICLRMSCPPGQPQRCKDCDRLCVSERCYQAHKAVTEKNEKSLCDKIYQCRICCKVIRRNECRQELHRCGTTKCPSCNQCMIATEHFCYLKKMSPKRPNERLIFFGFEMDQSSGEHIVNFALAQYADGTEKKFGYSACENFCAWLYTPEHKGFTAIARNIKGFDGQFIMAWILKQGMTPDVIPNGELIMSILPPFLKIRIIDSLNFLPMPLSEIPDCFGFKELRKGYFSHLFNIKQNQITKGPFLKPDFTVLILWDQQLVKIFNLVRR